MNNVSRNRCGGGHLKSFRNASSSPISSVILSGHLCDSFEGRGVLSRDGTLVFKGETETRIFKKARPRPGSRDRDSHRPKPRPTEMHIKFRKIYAVRKIMLSYDQIVSRYVRKNHGCKVETLKKCFLKFL